MSRIGLFGGSFNPIHNGHIALAKAILAQCELDEVWLMVSPQNPLKRDQTLLADDLRLQLAQQALRGEDNIKVSDYEFQLSKPSYTWNTLQHLKQDFPQHIFVLLIGGDNWNHFQCWRHWKDILRHHKVIVYPRNEYPGTVQLPLLNISSTEIRNRIKRHDSIEGMVPDNISHLIELYYAGYE